MNIACWLSLLRLLLLPLAVLPVSLGWSNGWFISAAVTTVAGLSDIFDGRLAKRTQQITALGARLDLLSDKVFVGAMLVLFAYYGVVPLWMPVIVILREVIISLVRFIRFRHRPPASDVLGKAKMAVSIVAIIWLALLQDYKNGGFLSAGGGNELLDLFLSLAPWAMLAAATLTVISGENYLLRYAREKRHTKGVESDSPIPGE